jgi:glycosyltransferase involved in cell wall biosynthesis
VVPLKKLSKRLRNLLSKDGGRTNPYTHIFDENFYREQFGEKAKLGRSAFDHFMQVGWKDRKNPSYLFDVGFYLDNNVDVKEAGANPLEHFCMLGWKEGRRPHALFDPSWYSARYGSHFSSDQDPLSHYLQTGWVQHFAPIPLFDGEYYLANNPDVRSAKVKPLRHYIEFGSKEGRRPHRFFDPIYYNQHYQDVFRAGIEPLTHYCLAGWRELRNPCGEFDVANYLNQLQFAGQPPAEPVSHFLSSGAQDGFKPAPASIAAPIDIQLERGEVEFKGGLYQPPHGLIPWFNPLNAIIDDSLSERPTLNVLVPGLGMKHMSGGPNTALNIAYRLAKAGITVRLVATDAPLDADDGPFWDHIGKVSGVGERLANVELVDASQRSAPFRIGSNDVFFATAWWTAQMVKYIVPRLSVKTFVYLIQDYEPILHPYSSQSAMAEETYGLDIIPVINTSLLADFLRLNKIGRFANEEFASRALAFEPAVDRTHFYHEETTGEKRTLLFYARPTNGIRNLTELGIGALQKAIAMGWLDPSQWRFVGMGEKFEPISLGGGAMLEAAPWVDFEGYAAQMRGADVLLSLMLSPHPSYPPLEMAACGKPVVTSRCANKDAEALSLISKNIIAVEPTIDAIALGLKSATTLTPDTSDIQLPYTWDETFDPVVRELKHRLLKLYQPAAIDVRGSKKTIELSSFPGFDTWPMNRYDVTRRLRLKERLGRLAGKKLASASQITFMSSVWNTHPSFLDELYRSVKNQNSGMVFKWIVLDNGSTEPGTIEFLNEISKDRSIEFHRARKNLGIIGGMKFLLDQVKTRYYCPLDSDDILTPDCVSVLLARIEETGHPAILYTNEDKFLEPNFRDPYEKPVWDPVLFSHSCYIAHLTCIDREKAIALGCYTDRAVEGSHDWDSFTRFYNAGYTPVLVPDVLYTWRMHPSSTAGNIDSKSYISTSQLSVMKRFVVGQAKEPKRIKIERSPLFNNSPDWRLTTAIGDFEKIKTLTWGEEEAAQTDKVEKGLLTREWLLAELDKTPKSVEYIHIHDGHANIADDTWREDATALFNLFGDTAMVGGRILKADHVTASASYFGFESGIGSPDLHRSIKDPGYFAQAWKPHTADAVPLAHAVFRRDCLEDALALLPSQDLSIGGLSAWLGLAFATLQKRVIYSPYFSVESSRDHSLTQGEQYAILLLQTSNLIAKKTLPENVDVRQSGGLRSISSSLAARQRQSLLDYVPSSYQDVHDGEVLFRTTMRSMFSNALLTEKADKPARSKPSKTTEKSGVKFSILTSVYARTDADLFAITAKSLMDQSLPFHEWVILKNGPVPQKVQTILDKLKADKRVNVLDVKINQGIVGALRICLDKAKGDWIIPMDADDVLTSDALEMMSNASSEADFLFSDEDILTEHGLSSPIRRKAFDPVLNSNDSYIYHLCAFRRSHAIELGVYSETCAEFAHDWDSVTRFQLANLRIVHVPHVLYHWRHHTASTSGSGETNTGSMASARQILEQVIERQKQPSLYEVAEYPLFRGAVQYGISRKFVKPLPVEFDGPASERSRLTQALTTVKLSARRATSNGNQLVLKVGPSIGRIEEEGLFDAMRMFEMYPEIDVCVGRIVSSKGLVVESGAEGGVKVAKSDPGPMAMYFKPHLTDILTPSLYIVKASALVEIDANWDNIADALAKALTSGKLKGVYTPLLTGHTH